MSTFDNFVQFRFQTLASFIDVDTARSFLKQAAEVYIAIINNNYGDWLTGRYKYQIVSVSQLNDFILEFELNNRKCNEINMVLLKARMQDIIDPLEGTIVDIQSKCFVHEDEPEIVKTATVHTSLSFPILDPIVKTIDFLQLKDVFKQKIKNTLPDIQDVEILEINTVDAPNGDDINKDPHTDIKIKFKLKGVDSLNEPQTANVGLALAAAIVIIVSIAIIAIVIDDIVVGDGNGNGGGGGIKAGFDAVKWIAIAGLGYIAYKVFKEVSK